MRRRPLGWRCSGAAGQGAVANADIMMGLRYVNVYRYEVTNMRMDRLKGGVGGGRLFDRAAPARGFEHEDNRRSRDTVNLLLIVR